MIHTFLQDLRYGARRLLHQPGLAAVAVVTLALGIGANAAIFSVVHGVLLSAPAVEDPERLVLVWKRDPLRGFEHIPLLQDELRFWRQASESLEGMAAISNERIWRLPVAYGEQPWLAAVSAVSADFFQVLGVEPHLGRSFRPQDQGPVGAPVEEGPVGAPVEEGPVGAPMEEGPVGAPVEEGPVGAAEEEGSVGGPEEKDPVEAPEEEGPVGAAQEEGAAGAPDQGVPPGAVVLSHRTWVTRFGRDPEVVGKSLDVSGSWRQIVGVAPARFAYPEGAELWMCLLRDSPAELDVLARIDARAGHLEVAAELGAVAHSYAEQRAVSSGAPTGSSRSEGRQLVVTPFEDELVGAVRRPLLILLGAVGLLLLIACANVANLLLSDGAARERQFAIRVALGADAGRVVRQLLTESLGLALLGGLAGVALAVVGVRLLLLLEPGALPRRGEIGVDAPVLAFALLLTVATALLFGLAPAVRAARSDAAEGLRAGGSRGGRAPRLMRALVVVEVASALVLLIGAGLLTKSFLRHQGLDRGFRSESLLSVALYPPEELRSADAMRRLYEELLPRLEAAPGVVSASPMLTRPLTTDDGWDAVFVIEGQSEAEAATNPWTNFEVVGSGHLQTMGIPLEEGRFFTGEDRADSEPVVVVNRALAERYWPGESALGRRLRLGSASPWWRVVGVIADVRYRDLRDVRLDIYRPLAQSRWPVYFLAIRTIGDTARVAKALRHEVWSLAPESAIDVKTMESLFAAGLAGPRFNALLISLFAVLALTLAAVGIYGVVSSLVGSRRHEMGVRLALGAEPGDVLRLVLLQGMGLALVGVVLGLLGAAGLSRVLSSLLFEVSPFDPPVFAALALILLAVALVAVYLPAVRATRVDAVETVRSE